MLTRNHAGFCAGQLEPKNMLQEQCQRSAAQRGHLLDDHHAPGVEHAHLALLFLLRAALTVPMQHSPAQRDHSTAQRSVGTCLMTIMRPGLGTRISYSSSCCVRRLKRLGSVHPS